jgi:cell division protein FtsW
MSAQATRFDAQEKPSMPLISPWVDSQVLLIYALLCGIGLVMVTSASIGIADSELGDPFYYGKRQFLRLLMAFVLVWLAWRIPTRFWSDHGMKMMLGSIFLLLLVLVPGLGHTVNGATRWLNLGAFTVQVSEIAKLFLIIYLSGYLIRRSDEITGSMGFIKPMVILAVAAGLLLLEPDFGAAAVLLATGLGMMFLGGVRFGHFFLFMAGTLSIMSTLALLSPYRMARITSFLDPWSDPFASGFQLVQALIAVGSGGLFGRGLGGSIQKLSYLPEAHTDFLFAIYAEEFGLVGIVLLIVLFVLFTRRCFTIARNAMALEHPFGAYLVYGVGLLVGIQSLINIGVNLGALPTKGLTLPFISYGGNSILIMSFAVGMVLRVHRENQEANESLKPTRPRAGAES